MSETATPAPPSPSVPAPSRTSRLVSASAVMAAGTALSRVMGFVRLMLLVVLFGNATRQADMFSIANTVPNSMYILLAGGVLNTVLVPQIVRAVKTDPDRGEAYTNRIMTAGLLVLGLITVLLTVAVPLVIALYSAPGWKAPGLAPQYHSMVLLGYYCMPQVFFYGVHVLAGQVLNARDRFGPMMWAPIANNVVSIVVLLLFLLVFGHTNTGRPFTSGEALLLGLGSTAGIVAQAAVLVPFLRAAGYHFRPRFDFRHTGLGKTFRLAKWTLGFVLVTQVALVVISRLASGATVGGRGAGLAAYYNAYAVWILPHSLITVSLATAMLPAASRLAAAGDLAGVAAETMRALRLAVTVLLPAAVAFLALGIPITHLAFGFGQGGRDAVFVGWALMALAVGLVPFTIQYLCLRAFYALEDTRTPFFLQLVISGANVVLGVSSVLLLHDPSLVAAGLSLSYSLAYTVGVVLSFRRLHHRLPGLDGYRLVRHCVRLLVAVLPAAVVGWAVCWVFAGWSSSRLVAALGLVTAGVVALGLFLVAARLLRVSEITDIIATLSRRRSGAAAEEPADTTQTEAVDLALAGPTEDPSTSSGHAGTSAGHAGTGPGHVGASAGHAGASAGHGGEEESMESGDSDTVIRPGRPTIEAPSTAVAPPPDGSTENAELMAQAALVRSDLDDADPPRHPALDAAVLPAGTVLASRYRLEELLAESEPTVTWRAFDQVLSRSVLVHLLAPGDPDEGELLAAARKASVATDSRFLRVLDAVHSTDPDRGSYIVCEYAVGQSLEVILSHGPLSGLESAWVVREVADALSGVHSLGLYHRRINPDTVIITPAGNVKIVGLLIEAALRPVRSSVVHGADTPELVDVLDLGRLLYASLVCRWPGGPAYSLPDAPVLGRRWMTPRQVRAGVSPALDAVCDQILGDPPRHRAPLITTTHGVVNALSKVLGSADASADLERRLRQPIPTVGVRPDRGTPPQVAPVSALLDQPTEPMQPVRPRVAAATTHTPGAARVSSPVGAGTPAVGAGPLRTAPPASPGSGDTTVIRRATGATRRRQPRRWIAVLLVLVAMLVVAGVVSAIALDRRLNAGPVTPSAAPTVASSAPSSASAPTVLTVVDARDFDPQGDDRTENPRQVKYAYDGNPRTRWTTVTYYGNPRLGNIKRGVGLVLDLGSVQAVRSVQVSLSGDGTDVDLRVPKTDPGQTAKPPMTSDRSWRTVAAQSKAGSTATLTPASSVSSRYLLVYLTSLPKEGKGYRGGIYEVEVTQ